MNLLNLIKKYNLHDSFFESVIYSNEKHQVEMNINFAFWMQEWYNNNIPENGIITILFTDVLEYICPSNIDWEQISIIQTTVNNDIIKFSLLNDITNEFLEIIIKCKNVSVIHSYKD